MTESRSRVLLLEPVYEITENLQVPPTRVDHLLLRPTQFEEPPLAADLRWRSSRWTEAVDLVGSLRKIRTRFSGSPSVGALPLRFFSLGSSTVVLELNARTTQRSEVRLIADLTPFA